MKPLKHIPFSFRGELHEICLVNFYVPMEEVLPFVPKPLVVRDFGGRAMISMVNVDLRRMRLRKMAVPEFHYRHIAFRLLVDDRCYTGTNSKGIFFLRSFASSRIICSGGNLIADFRFQQAQIQSTAGMLDLSSGEKFIRYALDPNETAEVPADVTNAVASIDRAYSVRDGAVWMLQILRERWPLRPVECYHFETNFFSKTEPAAAFVVDDPIHYDWLPAQKAQTCVS